jgi:hypothetical protein
MPAESGWLRGGRPSVKGERRDEDPLKLVHAQRSAHQIWGLAGAFLLMTKVGGRALSLLAQRRLDSESP